MMRLNKNIKYFGLALAFSLIAGFADADTVHIAKKGETIYGIAYMYHVSPDALLEANPQAKNGVKKGMALTIPDGSTPKKNTPATTTQPTQPAKPVSSTQSQPATQPSDAIKKDVEPERTQSLTYLASDGDNFEKISSKTGVPAGTLMELNPFLDPENVPSGTLVRLSENAPFYEDIVDSQPFPQEPQELPWTASPVDTLPAIPEQLSFDPVDAYDAEADEQVHKNILIMLPFMADNENPSKKAQLYGDFYRGFLIAANNKSQNGKQDVEIIVADTENNPQKMRETLSNHLDRELAVIIVPEDANQIQEIADSAAKRGIYVLNMFNFTDETYKKNPYAIQGNIVQSLMYDKAIDAVMNEYAGYIPVILSPSNARDEKTPFTDALRERYSQQGLETLEIAFDEVLEDTHLAQLNPEEKYVFIPRTGSQQVFNRYAPAILELMNQDETGSRFELFGYPDWTAYRGESLELLQRLGAKVYSRFACDEKDIENQDVQNAFLSWYGSPMIEAVPSQGLLGYDVANFLLEALQNDRLPAQLTSPVTYQGIQSTFKFRPDNPTGGFVNETLYLIKFLPGDHYSVKVL